MIEPVTLVEIKEVTPEYSRGFRDGLNFQFQSDCMAICWYCASSQYEPALFDAEADAFTHQKKGGGKKC